MHTTFIAPGDRFGRLELLREIESIRRPNGRLIRRGIFRCDCGVEKTISFAKVWNGETQSCGCLMVEAVRRANRIHGHATKQGRTRTFRSWEGALQRCNNSNDKDFQRYGGRGIRVCDQWHRFETFLADMGPCPPGHTLHRMDNDKNYEPGNCCWATSKIQGRHRRNNLRGTVRGITGCLSELCEHFGVNAGRAAGRISRGWTWERALFEPPHSRFD